jgi:hypothetical protein
VGAAIIDTIRSSPAVSPIPSRSHTLDERTTTHQPSPPGLFAQIRSTRNAGMRLVAAHIDLAKAEAKAIGDEIKRVAGFIALAIAVLLLAGILAVVGTSLFLGEWLLGSLGWGVLHGILLFVAIAVACALAAVGMSGGRIGRALLLGVLLGAAVAVLLVLAIPNRAYTTIGESALPNIEPGIRPLLVGTAILAAVGLLFGLVGAIRASSGAARVGALLGGIVVGALLGAVSAVDVGAQVGIGIGITVAYVTWIGLMAADIARTGVDTDSLKARFYPAQTIETSKETLAWLQSRMPPGTGS